MEPVNQPIVIEFSRIKMAGIFVASAVFVSLGIWFWLKPQDVVTSFLPNLYLIRIIGVACVVFFGAVGLFILKKMGDKRPAVIITDDGITDNSNASSAGFIAWQDVTDIREYIMANQRSVIIMVRNVDVYFNNEQSAFKRRLMKANYNLTGAVTAISANGLQCHYHQLKTLLEDGFANYKANSNKD